MYVVEPSDFGQLNGAVRARLAEELQHDVFQTQTLQLFRGQLGTFPVDAQRTAVTFHRAIDVSKSLLANGTSGDYRHSRL